MRADTSGCSCGSCECALIDRELGRLKDGVPTAAELTSLATGELKQHLFKFLIKLGMTNQEARDFVPENISEINDQHVTTGCNLAIEMHFTTGREKVSRKNFCVQLTNFNCHATKSAFFKACRATLANMAFP